MRPIAEPQHIAQIHSPNFSFLFDPEVPYLDYIKGDNF